MKKYQVVIIGAGAAGMMAGVVLARKGIDIAIIEHTAKAGTKLLATGNGRCNFTNLNMNSGMYNAESQKYVSSAFKRFNELDAISFFENMGVFAQSKDGYIYPRSFTSAALSNSMYVELDNRRTEFYFESEIKRIEKNEMFEITLSTKKGVEETFCAENVILATGSKAAPQTGSDGSGYKLAKSLGHNVIKPLPALTALISDNKYCRVSAGVRNKCEIRLEVSEAPDMKLTEMGEVQFTDYGISGIPVFQISHNAVKAVDMGMDVSVYIDFLPEYTYEELSLMCDKLYTENSFKNSEYFFEGLLNKKLTQMIYRSLGLDSTRKLYKEIEKNGQKSFFENVINKIKQFEYHITGFKSFEQAQVCQGGVSLEEIDIETMESKLVKGLYFAGEIVNVDGRCGGYNLQWAWTSAYIAAEGISNDIKSKSDKNSD